MLRKVARLGAVLFAGYAGSAFALGLGEINVASDLNQKFSATIPLFSASANDIDSLQVTLASPDEFERAGIERTDYVSSLIFKVTSGPGGPAIAISSSDIDREPFLSFLVQARWKGGKILREYTVLLDPPSLGPSDLQPAPAPAASAPPSRMSAAPSESASEPYPAPVRKPAAHGHWQPPPPVEAAPPADGLPPYSTAGASSYGPVSPKETLWSIGVKVKPDGATMDQILLALYSANPAAFDHGHFDGLIKGSTLTVPSAGQVTSVSPAVAKERVTELRAGRHLNPGAMSARPVGSAAPHARVPIKPVVSGAPAPLPPPIKPSAVTPPPPATVPIKPAETATPPPPAALPPPPTAPAEGTTAPSATPPPAEATPPPATIPPPAVVPPPKPLAPLAPPPPREDSFFSGVLYPVIALIILLVVVFLGWRTLRKKKKQEEEAAEHEAMPVPALMTTARNLSPGAFGTTTRTTPVPPPLPEIATKPVTPPRFDSETLEVRPFGSDSTVRMSEPPVPVPSGKKAGSGAGGGDVDFDLTSQFEAQTLAVNLDANDPISEADFHLAYGLYDEAAGLLKQAIAKEPDRKELRAKLCETYFAAGKPMEFQETAEGLHGSVTPGEWQKIAIMGRQLCPGSSMFSEDSGAQMTDMDLALDEPVAPEKPGASNEFMLGDFTDDEKTVFAPKAPASPAAGNSIDFDLDAELLKSKASTTLHDHATPGKPPEPAAAPLPDLAHERDLDLSHFDLAREPMLGTGGSDSTIDPSAGTVEFNLDELDLNRPVESHEFSTVTDEVSTKLDLARAYSDMGDNEAARSLLHEVIVAGTPAQREEAEALAKRLGG